MRTITRMHNTYERVAASPRRSFRLTVGTQQGYEQASKAADAGISVRVVEEWVRACLAAGLPYLSGIVTTGEVVYGWNDPVTGIQARTEPCVIFSGVLSAAHDADMSDDTAADCLESLAAELARAYEQTRAYIEFMDTTWIIQHVDRSTPRSS